MNKNRIVSIISTLLILVMLLSGCGGNSSESSSTSNSTAGSDTSESSSSDGSSSSSTDTSDMFTERDYEVGYDENSSVTIKLNGSSASCTSDAVEISGSTITIKDEGTFILSGQLDDGMIIVNAEENDKPQLVFNGVTINSETSAPIYILEGDKVFITLAADTENTLSNGGSYTAIDENNIDSVIFSKQDLTLNGSGSLTVTSPAGHGVVSKDDLVFTSGSYTVNCASHGLDVNDSVRIDNAKLTIDAGKDGIHAENSDDENLGFVYIASGTLSIEAEGDGISAGAYMQIEDGSFDITSGSGSANASQQSSESYGGFMGGKPGQHGMGAMGGSGNSDVSQADSSEYSDDAEYSDDGSTSIKGLKATGELLLNGGTFTIDSADDAVHSNTSITVNNGTFNIASGDDGFHADESLTINAGTIDISESYEGLEALDISVEGGDIKLDASDDGLNAAGGTDSSGFGGERGNDHFGGGNGKLGGSSSSNGSINISGGTLFVNASGDGIDANGSIEISGGYTTVIGPTQGDTATLDYDTSAVITGGTFIGTGAYGMAQTFSDSQQGVVAVSVGNMSAGTAVTLADSNGSTIIEYEPELDYAVVILSSPDIEKGSTYTITAGSASGEVQAS